MVTVSLPATMSVAENGGTVIVCASLSNAIMATEKNFTIALFTNDGTAMGN